MTEPFTPPAPAAACPCGRTDARRKPIAWSACCGPHLDAFATRPAPDAQALMRSRYSAFVLRHADYLLATWHASTRPASLELQPGTEWLGLEVHGHWPQPDGRTAQVAFTARYRERLSAGGASGATNTITSTAATGRVHRLRERSRFVHESGRWWYLDAV